MHDIGICRGLSGFIFAPELASGCAGPIRFFALIFAQHRLRDVAVLQPRPALCGEVPKAKAKTGHSWVGLLSFGLSLVSAEIEFPIMEPFKGTRALFRSGCTGA